MRRKKERTSPGGQIDASVMDQFMAKCESKLKSSFLADFSGFKLDGSGRTYGWTYGQMYI